MGAYTDGGMVCIECATELAGERVQDPEFIASLLRGGSVDLGLHTFIRYELDEMQDNDECYALYGIHCDNCGAVLAEPWDEEDIHDAFHYEYRVDKCEYCRNELAEECEENENERTSEYHEEDNDEQE